MCGPIALALPNPEKVGTSRFFHAMLYNAGRIVTYSLLGLLFGLIGGGFSIAGLQQYVSIGMGVLLLLFLVFPRMFNGLGQSVFAQGYDRLVKRGFGIFLRQKSAHSKFVIGLINGFLPCGLIYLAIAGAIATGSVVDGALYMTVFGLGTLPSMFILSFFGYNLKMKLGVQYKKILPWFITVIAVLFILRGLNLGIPYVSPVINSDQGQEVICH